MKQKYRLLFILVLVVGLNLSGLPQGTASGQDEKIGELITMLETRNWDKAVDELVKIGEPAVKPLLNALKSSLRFTPARSCYPLAQIGTKEAVDAVMEALRNPESPGMVREYAALALGDVPSEESISLLCDVLESQNPWRTRMFAADALGKIGSKKAEDVLIGVLYDDSLYVRGYAAESLGEIKSAAAAADVVRLLKDESEFVRIRARKALVWIGEAAVGPLLQALGDEDGHFRWMAVWILGNIQTEEAAGPLLKALEDPEWRVRDEAALVLTKLDAKDTVTPLIDLLKHERCFVREEAAWILGKIEAGPAVVPLLQVLDDKEMGWMAATALGEISSEKAVPLLIEAMASENIKLRRAAAWALGKIRSIQSAAPLKKSLADIDWEVRMWAAAALENISTAQFFTAAQLQEDFRQMREIMEGQHPAMYTFTDKEAFDLLFEEQFSLIDRPLTLREFYLIAAPLVTKIGCGHSKLKYPENFWATSSRLRIPLRLIFHGTKVFVLEVVGNPSGILPGSEILSINGRPMDKIIETFKSTFSTDGFIDTYRVANLNMNFPFEYARRFGFPDVFELVFRLPGEIKNRSALIQAVDMGIIGKAIDWKPVLDCKIIEERKTAVIKINSFVYYQEREKFKTFVDSAFQKIQEKNLGNLVLDFRGNFGGDPFCAAHLFSYIIPRPLVYFSKPYGRYAKLAEPIPLAENRFQGNIYILIDGWCFSTTGHLCALLKYHNIGTFIGEETGATYTCNDDKRIDHLKNTGFGLQLARGSFSVAVEGMPKDRGIVPDYPVWPTVQDLISGKDTVLEMAFCLIDKGN